MCLGIRMSSTLQDDVSYLSLSLCLSLSISVSLAIYLSSVTRNSLGGGCQLQSGRNIASTRGMSFPAEAKERISPSRDM